MLVKLIHVTIVYVIIKPMTENTSCGWIIML